MLAELKNTNVSTVLKALELSTSKMTAWKKGSVPSGDILVKLADYFDVSVDYLLERTDIPYSLWKKEKPAYLQSGLFSEIQDVISCYCSASPEVRKMMMDFLRFAEDQNKDLGVGTTK